MIITSCAVIIFLIRPRKFQHFISLKKVLKKDKNDSQDDNSQKNKSQEQIINCPELSNPNWIKIGSVKRLYIYPLTGCRTAFPTLKFTKYGISTESEGMTVWDRLVWHLKFISQQINGNNAQNIKDHSICFLYF